MQVYNNIAENMAIMTTIIIFEKLYFFVEILPTSQHFPTFPKSHLELIGGRSAIACAVWKNMF